MKNPEQILELEALNLLRLADMLGMNVEIINEPLKPLAMGHTRPAVRVWVKRKPAVWPEPKGPLP